MKAHDTRFDGFSIKIYLDNDGDWLAHFIELPEISAFGDSLEQAIKELEEAWAGTKESYIKLGRQVPSISKISKTKIHYMQSVPSIPRTKRKSEANLYNALNGQRVTKRTAKKKVAANTHKKKAVAKSSSKKSVIKTRKSVIKPENPDRKA